MYDDTCTCRYIAMINHIGHQPSTDDNGAEPSTSKALADKPIDDSMTDAAIDMENIPMSSQKGCEQLEESKNTDIDSKASFDGEKQGRDNSAISNNADNTAVDVSLNEGKSEIAEK